MAVYVDDANVPFGRMIMCHMVADTLDELNSMADVIGVNRKWFQDHPKHPHYDISRMKKALALQNGAIEVTSKELITIIKGIKYEL
jgi:hypothetical protein